jgi:hypothetical protein
MGHDEVPHSDAFDAAHIRFAEVSIPKLVEAQYFNFEAARIEVSVNECKASYATTNSYCFSAFKRQARSANDTYKSSSKASAYGQQRPTYKPTILKKP